LSQQRANPWVFSTSDVAASVAITSIAGQGASALVTTSTAHGLSNGSDISIQGVTGTGAIYNGGYEVAQIGSTTTFSIPLNLPSSVNSGAVGNVLTAAYLAMIRAEQITWSGAAAGDTLLLTDAQGNTIWNPTAAVADSPYVSAKVFWVGRGLVINALPHGNLQMTIN
jgi:hypothetical protein